MCILLARYTQCAPPIYLSCRWSLLCTLYFRSSLFFTCHTDHLKWHLALLRFSPIFTLCPQCPALKAPVFPHLFISPHSICCVFPFLPWIGMVASKLPFVGQTAVKQSYPPPHPNIPRKEIALLKQLKILSFFRQFL